MEATPALPLAVTPDRRTARIHFYEIIQNLHDIGLRAPGEGLTANPGQLA